MQGWGERFPNPTAAAHFVWLCNLQASSPTARCIGTTKDISMGILSGVSAVTSKKGETPKSGSGSGGTSNHSAGSKKAVKKPTSTPSVDESKASTIGNRNKSLVVSEPPPDVPRRIIVIKDVDSSQGKDVDKAETAKTKQPFGVLKRRFPLEREIIDSGGKLIWTPSKAVVERGIVVATQLPQIHATAWLDPAMYCRDGGTSIAGTDAARKLLRGKRDLMELLGHAVHTNTTKYTTTIATDATLASKNRDYPKSYVLQGHGVPPQMLQHLIDFAASLLYRLDAAEVSFKQFNVTQHHNSVAASDAVRDLQRSHVRDLRTGENKVVPWPLDGEDHWKDDLQLYWTVMNRIATRLGLAVLLKRPREVAIDQDSTSSQPSFSDHFNQTFSSSNSLLKTPPHHWKVEFTRQWQFATQQLPPGGKSHLYPILEWAPLDGVATPGHVCIWLQGLSSAKYSGAALQVSLCFDACFRRNLTSSYGTL
jgi:hypothetical protein